MAGGYNRFDKSNGKREGGNQIKCEKCGNLFAPKQPHHKTCPQCHFGPPPQQTSDLKKLLLNTYYDDKGILKEVFINIPEQIADIFNNNGLSSKQLRSFHSAILKARTKANMKGIDTAKSLLWECQKNAEYQLNRKQIPRVFMEFLKHHLSKAEENEKNLEGFYQHFDAIVCYFAKY
jgi:CRISPR/Cas system CSM-associated protein Csm2 small subunit/ribosomal protein L37E